MTWLFSKALMDSVNLPCSPEPAAESSAGTCSDGEPSAQWSVMPRPQGFWRKGKMMEPCRLSPSGPTLRRLTEAHGDSVLTLFLAAFPVRTLAQPARAPASKANAPASGVSTLESLAKYDPVTRSWRTPQLSLLGDWDEFSETWPKWGSMRNGECWARTPLDLTTDVKGSGSLPTPSGVNGGKNNVMGRLDEWGGSGNRWRGTEIGKMRCASFEEWMMGWPMGWSARTPLEMAKFQEWQQQHSLDWLEGSDAA